MRHQGNVPKIHGKKEKRGTRKKTAVRGVVSNFFSN